MDIRLDGKAAVVTGASKGIGLAIARAPRRGRSRRACSRRARPTQLERAAATLEGAGGKVSWRVAHAGDPEQAQACVEATLEEFGRLDILVNNAATNPHFGPMLEIDRARAEKTVEVNQLGLLAWCQSAWRLLDGRSRRDDRQHRVGGRARSRARHRLVQRHQGRGDPPHPPARLRARHRGCGSTR